MWKIILLACSVIFAGEPEFGDWRWADDTMEFTMDKEAHLCASFGFYFLFKHKGFSEGESALYTLYLGLGKEVIDALLP